MQIEKDKVVTLNYRVSDVNDQLIEATEEGQPLAYLHGHGAMLQQLEDALQGRGAGDTVSMTIENAYGVRDDSKIQRVSINHIMRDGKAKPKLKPGMLVYLNTEHGPRPVIVLKVGLKAVDVDINHPYAGMTLKFDVEVLNVRDATEEEIEHGHVHGEGGVNH